MYKLNLEAKTFGARFDLLKFIPWSVISIFSTKKRFIKLMMDGEFLGFVEPSISGWIAASVTHLIFGKVTLESFDLEELL